jgi:TnpA family transposase
MDIRKDVIERCDQFCGDYGFSENRFGRDAVGDHRFMKKLRERSGVTLTIIERAEKFMVKHEKRAAKIATSKAA